MFLSMMRAGIQQIVSTDNFQAGKCRVITDGNGYIAVPGFINEHIHGLGGVDVMDDDPQALAIMAKTLARNGCYGLSADDYDL